MVLQTYQISALLDLVFIILRLILQIIHVHKLILISKMFNLI